MAWYEVWLRGHDRPGSADAASEEVAQNDARPPGHDFASFRPVWRRGHAPLCAFRDEFGRIFAALEEPWGAALFQDRVVENHFYFSPRAAEIAQGLVDRHCGRPCAAPRYSSVALACGHAGSPDIAFRADYGGEHGTARTRFSFIFT